MINTLKKYSSLLLLIILVLLGSCCFVLYGLYSAEKQEKERLGSNWQNEVKHSTEAFTQLSLVKGELKDMRPGLDSIRKTLSIKEKNLVKIVTYETYRRIDSVNMIGPVALDTFNRLIKVSGSINCFSTEAIIDLRGTGLKPTDMDVKMVKMNLTNIQVKDSGSTFYYKKRDSTKALRFWPFAKMKFYSKSVSACESQAKMQELIFEKNK